MASALFSPVHGSFSFEKDKAVQEVVNSLEAYRQEAYSSWLKRLVGGLIVGGLGVLIFIAAFFGLSSVTVVSWGFLGLLGLGCLVAFYIQRPAVRFRRQFIRHFMPDLGNALGGFSFKRRDAWTAKELRQWGIIPPHHTLIAWNGFQGRYNDSVVHTSLAHMEYGMDDDPRKNHTAFHGILGEITLPREFPGNLVIVRDYGFVANSIIGTKYQSLQSVTLEDPRFESLFQVYGSDQITSRRLLTPIFMEGLADIISQFSFQSLALSVKGNKIFVMAAFTAREARRRPPYRLPSLRQPITMDVLKREIVGLTLCCHLVDGLISKPKPTLM